MKQFLIRNALPLLFLFSLVAVPAIAGAQPTTGQFAPAPNTGQYSPSPNTGQYTPGGSGFSLENPLRFGSFCQLLKGILGALVAIGIPVAVLFLVWTGFKFILARGDTAALAAARQSFLYTVIGIAIFLGAWVIAQVIASTVQQFGITILSCQ